MSARRWAEFLVPDALGVHIDWLRDLVQGEDGLLAQVSRSSTATRMLTRRLYQRHGISVPARATLGPQQQWLLSGQTQQVELARRLGIESLHEVIRTTVDATLVASLRKALGDDGYRRAVAGGGLSVTGIERASFIAAVRAESSLSTPGVSKLDEYLVSVGAAVLETTAQAGDAFSRMRMRFAFSPACWRARPQGLVVDQAQLAKRIAELTEGMT